MLTHLDKVYFPEEGITKGDLIRYYEAVSPWLLPHLKDRPESLRRYPEGIAGESFFQKNLQSHPEWIATYPIDNIHYLLIQNEESLLYAANLGCIELHPFLSRTQTLGFPDFVVLDLDPKDAPFEDVIRIAKEVHALLEELGAASCCKTSGASGLHIAIPLGAQYTYEQALHFAELLAAIVHDRLPEISTLERSLADRKDRVYIDCYQNLLGQTIAAPYSVRALPGAPVSTPLKWSEVKKGLRPSNFTIKNIPARLRKMGDLYAPVLGKGIDLSDVIRKI